MKDSHEKKGNEYMTAEKNVARATQIRIATGTTAYAGDPECEEGIRAREVRVEVTYRLAPGEDPAVAALLKADEVERTRLAVWQRIRNGSESERPEDPSLEFGELGPEPPDDDSCYPEAFPEEAHYIAPGIGKGYSNGNGRPGNGSISPHPHGGNPAPSAPIETVEWATKPQQMAIKSHYLRLGLSPEDQAALLRERFQKAPYQRLTKAEAAQLMRTLERGEWHSSPEAPPAVAHPIYH